MKKRLVAFLGITAYSVVTFLSTFLPVKILKEITYLKMRFKCLKNDREFNLHILTCLCLLFLYYALKVAL